MLLKDPFEDLHGLEGLYVFVNHPARVTIYKGHRTTFDRLMHESSEEVQNKYLNSTKFPGEPRVVERCADNGVHSHWDLVDKKTGETLWSEDPDHKTNLISLAMEYIEENIKSLKIYTVMGEFVEWLQAKGIGEKKKAPECVGVSTCGGCDPACPVHPTSKKKILDSTVRN